MRCLFCSATRPAIQRFRQFVLDVRGRQGGSWISLFGPLGVPSEQSELIWRFREIRDRERARCAFYQVRPESLPLYVDAGLTLTKLGEEARVELREFDLKKPEQQ